MMVLYIFSGLPATGKSTLAAELAKSKSAVYLRLDTIEQAIKNSTGLAVGPEGYEVAYVIAAENLALGLEVVADSVNSLEITRQAWRNVAISLNCTFVEIEVVCSDINEHKRRVETRRATVSGLVLPTWQQVLDRNYADWTSDPDSERLGQRITIDTAGETVEQSVQKLFSTLERSSVNHP